MTVLEGDCLTVLPTLEADSFDSCVTDPPYHLVSIVKRFGKPDCAPLRNDRENGPYRRTSAGFMGKQWDGGDVAARPETWAAVYRTLKPGAHLVAFGGTRTYHRMACAIEDAGFEIRDCIQWIYGSGFPKSHDVSKGIDRAAGVEREVLGTYRAATQTNNIGTSFNASAANEHGQTFAPITAPATDAARQWQGWGTALKPAVENIVCARKPYDLQIICNILARKVMEDLCRLPSLASAAGSNSPLSQSVFGMGGESVSVQWNAVLKCNTPDDLFALMDTLPSESEIPFSLNIGLSWLAILGEVSTLANTFTTETKSSLTTDLKTLNFLLCQTTQNSIIQVATPPNGTALNASPVAVIFSAVATRLNCIRVLSAAGIATSRDALADIHPNSEPIVLARKPLSEGTVAANVLKWGTGAINVDGCRVPGSFESGWSQSGSKAGENTCMSGSNYARDPKPDNDKGRWPANVVHDGSDEVVQGFPDVHGAGVARVGGAIQSNDGGMFGLGNHASNGTRFGDEGSAARFFYTAKADGDERIGSKHPTVKPIDLMQWLVRLVTPKGGCVLDPFAGTGTTGEAAWREGCRATLIEREAEYLADIARRLELMKAGPDERTREIIKASGKAQGHEDLPLFGGGP